MSACDGLGHWPDAQDPDTRRGRGWRLVPPQLAGETREPEGWQLRGAVCHECGQDIVRAVFVGPHGLDNRASAWVTTADRRSPAERVGDIGIYFPAPPGAPPEHGGHWMTLPAVLNIDPVIACKAVGLPLNEYLEHVERWAEGPGFTYGVRVDREAQTIRQAGRQ